MCVAAMMVDELTEAGRAIGSRLARVCSVLMLGVLAGCAAEGAPAVAQTVPCRVAQALVQLPGAVPETSGVAVSRLRRGVFWTHNDSGGEAEIYGVDPLGQLLGFVEVAGAENEDWEDIEVGPCGDGACLYIADIGDNGDDRDEIVVYRMPEPTPAQATTAPGARFVGEYPDGAQDAEAFFVLPPDRMFIVTKGTETPIGLYRFPEGAEPEEVVELERIRSLSAGPVPLTDRVTGASATADGSQVALRTRTSLLIYDAEALVSGADVTPMNIALSFLGEPQGEGIAFGPDGAIVLTSEGGTDGVPGMMGIIWCPIE